MELFNMDIKNNYLDATDNNDVRAVYESVFRKSRSTETLYNKDLYDFNLKQIEKVIRNINPTTFSSVNNTKSRINTYINWAIQNGHRVSNINPLQGVTKEWEKRFIVDTSERYLTDVDIFDLTESLDNAQDQALIQCIFEGISGRGMSELISMNANNIDWDNNSITVKDDKDDKSRTVKVSDRCIKFVENAYKQKVYISEATGNETELEDFEGSILKNTVWKNSKNRQVTRGNLAKRLYTIKDKYELPALTVNTISESGRIKMAYDIFKKQGRLDKEELAKIADKFNLSKMSANGYSYYDTTKMKNYISSENLKTMYDVEVSL